ncbi:hypothetical protein B8W99_21605 [Peribacillus simplex]|nr:hypothetical protein B8W99_21605 [Peribacillus simplex]
MLYKDSKKDDAKYKVGTMSIKRSSFPVQFYFFIILWGLIHLNVFIDKYADSKECLILRYLKD